MRSFFMLSVGLLVAGIIVVSSLAQMSRAQQPPAGGGGGADAQDFVVSEMRVQTFPPRTYLYTTQQTTLAQIGEAVGGALTTVWEAVQADNATIQGAPVFVYLGATAEMDKPFELQVGFPVADGTEAPEGLKVRELEEFRCATVLYSGSMENIAQAYQQAYTDLFQAGLQPTGTNREMHLYFESPESPNNVVMLQIGVKE